MKVLVLSNHQNNVHGNTYRTVKLKGNHESPGNFRITSIIFRATNLSVKVLTTFIICMIAIEIHKCPQEPLYFISRGMNQLLECAHVRSKV